MTHRDATKRPINMGMVRQELQHLATQQMLATSRKRRLFSRRTFLILGALIGLAGLGVISSQMTDWVAFQTGLRAFTIRVVGIICARQRGYQLSGR
jgi:uncharacterized membrane protein YcjF (UPF0283 family)